MAAELDRHQRLRRAGLVLPLPGVHQSIRRFDFSVDARDVVLDAIGSPHPDFIPPTDPKVGAGKPNDHLAGRGHRISPSAVVHAAKTRAGSAVRTRLSRTVVAGDPMTAIGHSPGFG